MKSWGETLKSILSWTFAAIGTYLIGREFYSFVFIQPTSLEVTTARMSTKYLPDILLCPEPTFILEAVERSGFEGTIVLSTYIAELFFRWLRYVCWQHLSKGR